MIIETKYDPGQRVRYWGQDAKVTGIQITATKMGCTTTYSLMTDDGKYYANKLQHQLKPIPAKPETAKP